MSKLRTAQQGDTIIELVLAFAIFSLAAITTLVIMNQGVSMSQRSLETTFVRQQMDSQAEMLRYIRDADQTTWKSIIDPGNIATDIMPLAPTQCPQPSDVTSGGRHGFYMTHDTASGKFVIKKGYAPATTYARVDYTTQTTQGIWIQVAKAENKSPSDIARNVTAYDFYIHGCWYAPGQTVPMTLGTIARLYEN